MRVKMVTILYSGLSLQQGAVVAATAMMAGQTKTLNLAAQVVVVGMVHYSGRQAHLGKVTLVVQAVLLLHMVAVAAVPVKPVKPTMMVLDRLKGATVLIRQLLAHLFIEQAVAALEHTPLKQE
jgi:hypothetical protein